MGSNICFDSPYDIGLTRHSIMFNQALDVQQIMLFLNLDNICYILNDTIMLWTPYIRVYNLKPHPLLLKTRVSNTETCRHTYKDAMDESACA